MRLKLVKEDRREVRPEVLEGNGVVVGGSEDSPAASEFSVSDQEVYDAAAKLYDETYNSFYLFVEKIFSLAIKEKYGRWISGNYIKRSCDFLQNNKRTMYVSGRSHFKSLRYYSYLAWLVWKNKRDKLNISIAYISYNQDLAGAHIGKFKELINKSFFMSEGLYDEYSTATQKAQYMWPEEGKTKQEIPHIDINCYGIMGGLRGIHPDYTFLDDVYSDESRQDAAFLEPETVKKINILFRKVVIPMPLPGGELHIIGTPQSYSDLWYQKEFYRKEGDGADSERFEVRIEPAITSWDPETRSYREGEEKKALWPEMFSLEFLEEREAVQGKQEFQQEYLTSPKISSDSFFEMDKIDESIRLGRENLLVNYANFDRYNTFKKDEWFGYRIFAAYDAGKIRHPAHFVVFAYNNGTLTQLLSKWMDGWSYTNSPDGKPSQFEYMKEAVKHFGIQKIWGDNTNAILEGALEQRDIPGLVGLKITHSLKSKMALSLQKTLGTPRLLLLDDERQKRALLAVQNDRLKIAEGKDHHGESFTTLAFIVMNTIEMGKGNVVRRITVKTEKDKLPKYYKGTFFERGTNRFGSVDYQRLPGYSRRNFGRLM